MHDPEQFQKETAKAITDLQHMLGHALSRLLAQNAVLTAVLNRAPLAALPTILEEYELQVDIQAAQLPPEYQQRKHWDEWSTVIEGRRKQLQQLHDQQKGK